MDEEIIKQYLSANKNLTLLDGKKPTINNWTTKKIPKKLLNIHKGNLGWVLGDNDLVIDVDPKNGGDKSYEKLLDNLSIELIPTVKTPSGGFHIYLEIPKKWISNKFKKTLPNYPGIDFLTKGSQCVIPGSSVAKGKYTWADDLFEEFEQEKCPKEIISLITRGNKSSLDDDDDDLDDLEAAIGSFSVWPIDKVKKMLNKLDHNMPNDDWAKVGMALHDWDPDRGLELFEEWSLGGDTYKEGECEARWRSFESGGGVTLGTISYMAREIDIDSSLKIVNDYIKEINNVEDEKTLKFTIIPKIQKEKFDKYDQEKLAKIIQDRIKQISDFRMSISNVRNMIKKPQVVSGTFIDDKEIPEWCKDWVHVNSHDGFVNLNTFHLHKYASFNVRNGKYIPITEAGGKPSASKYVSDHGFTNNVDLMAYLPTSKEIICEMNGSKILNSFNHKTVPLEAEEYTTDGLKAIELVKKHVSLICNGNIQNIEILTSWLAHQVQFPGVKILFAPVIQSIQGVGKSFFAELLRTCLGDQNVGTVAPSQVTSNFNDWATGTVATVLEELRVKGHNRYEAVNALKTLITDRMIQINSKGIAPYMTYNTTNYICFTNDKDAIPMDHNDRRWWVIFVLIESLAELERIVGEAASSYFPKLFTAIRSYGPEIRKWFLEYEITEEFMNMKQAPMTDSKQSMIAAEEINVNGLTETKDLIAKGGKYYNISCVSSSDLFENLLFEYSDLEINNSSKNFILKKLGYMPVPKPVKLDGKARRVWTKKPMSNKNIRISFSKKSSGEDDF